MLLRPSARSLWPSSPDDVGVEDGRLVPRLEDYRIDLRAVGRGGERPHVAAEEIDPPRRLRQVGEVEDLDVVLRRHRHEGAARGEDDVGRLVADEERARHRAEIQVDDADRVREAVDHPRLAVGPRDDGDRLEADRDRLLGHEPAVPRDREDLEEGVRGVDREQPAAGRGQVDGMDVGRLEVDV
jgi:hypothetical protein